MRWLAFLVLLVRLPMVLGADPPRRQILILHSYNESYGWVSQANQGLRAELESTGWDLWYDYLDAKNLEPGFDFRAYDGLLNAKYGNRRFDLVVTFDDPAYEYFARTRDSLFHGVSGVSLGLNQPPGERLPGISYVYERPDYAQTLRLALDQNPGATTVAVVLDRSLSGLKIRRQMVENPPTPPIRWIWLDQGTAAELIQRLDGLPRPLVVAYGVYFNPEEGYESNSRILRRITEAVEAPVYTFWDFNLESGALGGYVYSSEEMGRQAGRMARDRLTAGAPDTLTDVPAGRWEFLWPVAQKFGLEESSFPKDARFIGRPADFWQVDRTTASVFLGAFGLTTVFLLLLAFLLRAQKTLLRQGRDMIATQRELMHSLGNVIETRSDETANHVERITRLALWLADRYGLDPRRRQMLELCAPMHDIGKVGIPDAVLKKPGPLTEDERRLMNTHTLLGWAIFRDSPNPMIRAASRIARDHHEHWDGGGYPDGRAGDQIDLLARIVSVVDVADALLTPRVYKPAWEPDRVYDYLVSQSGRMFDPELAALVTDRWDEFLALTRH